MTKRPMASTKAAKALRRVCAGMRWVKALPKNEPATAAAVTEPASP